MKTLILTLGTLVVSQFLSSQIGVVTLRGNND
jgi:hypothetical protein